MFLETLFSIVPQIDFIIFVSTFAGSLAGEFNKETTNKTPCSFPKFISQLLSSWMTSFATILFIHSTFNINDYNILISTSIIFGFIGYKYTISFIKKLITTKFNSDE